MASRRTGFHSSSLADGLRLLPLAGGTLLLLLGAFCAWQTWLVSDEGHVVARVHLAQDQAIRAVGAVLDRDRAQVQRALAAVDVAGAQANPAAAVAALKVALPQATAVDMYSGNLDEVLHANYHDFGYAKAAQLLAAQTDDALPVQSVMPVARGGGRQLAFVLPLGPPQRPMAWAWIELPFTPVQHAFESVSPAGGRLDLCQGDDRNAMSLLSRGSASGLSGRQARSIPGSGFSVGATLPTAFIVLPRSWPLDALLALVGLGAGAFLLWLFARSRRMAGGFEEQASASPPEPAAISVPRPSPSPPPAPAALPTKMAVDPGIFRAYDVRGIVGKTLDHGVARLLGQAIGTMMLEKGLREIVVGRDGRLSGAELAAALAEGLRAAGIDVIDLGAVPTPAVYYAAFRFNTGSGVAVTGSHNPPDYNGFKIVVGGETLAEDAIQDLYRRIADGRLEGNGQGSIRSVDVVPDYVERIIADVQAERSLKVVVDCGNGIAGAVAPQVLQGIGCEIIPLYCDVDGSFPNHHPDPSDPRNLADLILAVKQTGADLGLAFDGDGDRLGVVARGGEIIYPDRTLMLFARDVLSRQPGATIIYDVKCTGHLKGQILDAGGSPLMWRTGHSLIKRKMRETDAALAGEMSGHFFFKERWYGFDDGIYAGARLLEILAGDPDGRTPEQIFASCPKGVSTPELKIEMAEGAHHRFIEAFREQASFGDATLITIDGVRADWPDGWGLVRASNTTPVLVLRFDADNAAALRRIQQVFREQLLRTDPSLKLPF